MRHQQHSRADEVARKRRPYIRRHHENCTCYGSHKERSWRDCQFQQKFISYTQGCGVEGACLMLPLWGGTSRDCVQAYQYYVQLLVEKVAHIARVHNLKKNGSSRKSKSIKLHSSAPPAHKPSSGTHQVNTVDNSAPANAFDMWPDDTVAHSPPFSVTIGVCGKPLPYRASHRCGRFRHCKKSFLGSCYHQPL